MLGPTEFDILKYCYHRQRIVTITEIEEILPIPSVAKDYVKILSGRLFLEPLKEARTKITEKGILEVEQYLPDITPGEKIESR